MRHRVLTSHLSGWFDPGACFEVLSVGNQNLYWLDSGVDAHTGISCMGVGTRLVTAADPASAQFSPDSMRPAEVFDFLRQEQATGIDDNFGGLGFPLGWVGWLGYELHEATLHTGLGRTPSFPTAAFLFAERSIVFDHQSQTVKLVALGENWAGELADWREDMQQLLAGLPRPSAKLAASEPATFTPDKRELKPDWAYSDREYLRMIEECQRAIRAGDAYQLCLTTEVTVATHPDPIDTYLRLRELSPSHHGGLVRIGSVSLLSSSPEKFLSVNSGGKVESKPIKGTRKRGSTPQQDALLKSELQSSQKERAENLMIVDLVRNDLTRVCQPETVTVTGLLEVESYAQVHQLVSTVCGTLAAGFDAVDAVLACFPAGSMTGAPKLSAVKILDQLERRPRGVYAGAWGYFGLDGSVELAMTIRSILIDPTGVSIGTGGGITALSVPQDELEETKIKVAALLQALGLITL